MECADTAGVSGKMGSRKRGESKHCSWGPRVMRLSPPGQHLQLWWRLFKQKRYEDRWGRIGFPSEDVHFNGNIRKYKVVWNGLMWLHTCWYDDRKIRLSVVYSFRTLLTPKRPIQITVKTYIYIEIRWWHSMVSTITTTQVYNTKAPSITRTETDLYVFRLSDQYDMDAWLEGLAQYVINKTTWQMYITTTDPACGLHWLCMNATQHTSMF